MDGRSIVVCLCTKHFQSKTNCKSPEEMYLTKIFYRLLSQWLEQTDFTHLLFPSNCSATCKTNSLNDEGRRNTRFDASQACSSANVNTQEYLRGSKTARERYFEGSLVLCAGRCFGYLFPVRSP